MSELKEADLLANFLCKMVESKKWYKNYRTVIYNPKGFEKEKIDTVRKKIIKKFELPDGTWEKYFGKPDPKALMEVFDPAGYFVMVFCKPVPMAPKTPKKKKAKKPAKKPAKK
ncbi:MAG: hypothetical protein ACW981_19845 [Candidatus Hodarchaeales archaeon]|jgi:hypothetical protein